MPPLPLEIDNRGFRKTARPAARARLAICLVVIAATWLLVLPALAKVPAIRAMIDRHEADGVDPSAKFYSELPAMPMISQRVDEIRRAQPEAFGLSVPSRVILSAAKNLEVRRRRQILRRVHPDGRKV